MQETESITVAAVSDGPCGTGRPGTPVDLPVVELLTGRGFITGKSGSGKSNSASVVAENLLDNGFGLLIVDIDGEYYGLKEEYEILHAGADEECDIQVGVDHAEKLASLALEENVPVILDISSFLDEDEARQLLTNVAKHLFAKAKKQKQPFLMLVEEVHEYIPQQGSVGECGKMLIKISKRGRKHGLGIVGVSQRPADVKKDFITQCDWLVWHRLTWNNDTKVVSRILDNDYASAVEDLDDGEAFLDTDWSATVRRVQFHRKQTFDAGATPGLDDFERPDLKSVSDDLVSELQTISEQNQQREDRVAELRNQLDQKNSRIAELESELQDARDMRRMADQFTQALVEQVRGAEPGRTERERMHERRRVSDDGFEGMPRSDESERTNQAEREEGTTSDDANDGAVLTWPENDGASEEDTGAAPAGHAAPESNGSGAADGLFGMAGAFEDDAGGTTPEAGHEGDLPDENGKSGSSRGGQTAENGDVTDTAGAVTRGFGRLSDNPLGDRATNAFAAGTSRRLTTERDDDPPLAEELADEVEDLGRLTKEMLRYYRDHGPGTPMDALFSAGGSEDRTAAYARNRQLRVRGLVEHVGRGRYESRLPELCREGSDSDTGRPLLEQVESALAADA
jgi:hypothetical protein